jgi:hypothetical protein
VAAAFVDDTNVFIAGTTAADTLLGFGLEQVTAPADRTKPVKQAPAGLGAR